MGTHEEMGTHETQRAIPSDQLDDQTPMRLQSSLDKRGKAVTMLANILKKISDTSGEIARNLK
jgi:hypothetical protein